MLQTSAAGTRRPSVQGHPAVATGTAVLALPPPNAAPGALPTTPSPTAATTSPAAKTTVSPLPQSVSAFTSCRVIHPVSTPVFCLSPVYCFVSVTTLSFLSVVLPADIDNCILFYRQISITVFLFHGQSLAIVLLFHRQILSLITVFLFHGQTLIT